MDKRLAGVALWLALSCQAAASEAAAAEKAGQAAQIRQRIQAVTNSLGLREHKKDSLQGRLSDVERRGGDLSKRLKALDSEIAKQNQQLRHVREQKDRLLASLRNNNRGLDSQVRAAYMTGRQEWLKLFLNPDDPARISRVMTYYGYLTRSRLQQMQQIRHGLEDVAGLEQQLSTEKGRLEQLQSDLRERQSQLAATESSRSEILADLKSAWRDRSLRLQELSGNLQRLDRLVASVGLALADIPAERPRSRGMLHTDERGLWPVEGPLLARFGASRMVGRDGVVIRADEGTPVQAAAAGRVVFADWMRGYGLMLILQHNDGYMSLYAFNQALYKDVGDEVAAGETIATVGRSGGRRQAALYFGVRQAGNPVDPLQWLQPRG